MAVTINKRFHLYYGRGEEVKEVILNYLRTSNYTTDECREIEIIEDVKNNSVYDCVIELMMRGSEWEYCLINLVDKAGILEDIRVHFDSWSFLNEAVNEYLVELSNKNI